MYKKVINYVDFDGNERSDEFYFNLTEAEVTKWLLTTGDYTLDKVLLKISKERNGKAIIENFENLIRLSYGVKSLDGIRFEKSDELWNAFKSTNAYSVLFMELVTDAKKAVAFVNGIIPPDIAAKAEEIISSNPEGIPDEMKDYLETVKDVTKS